MSLRPSALSGRCAVRAFSHVAATLALEPTRRQQCTPGFTTQTDGSGFLGCGVPAAGSVGGSCRLIDLRLCYLNAATVAYGSADCGRKRLIVNFVG